MQIRDIIIISAVIIFVAYAVIKEVKALLTLKKMPEFINRQTKPVIFNSIILTIVDIFLVVLSFLFVGNFWFYVLLLVASLIGVETIFFVEDELRAIMGER